MKWLDGTGILSIGASTVGTHIRVKAAPMAGEVPHRIDDLLRETIGNGKAATYGGEGGVLIIATLAAAAKLQNDADCYRLCQGLANGDKRLEGKYLIWQRSDEFHGAGTIHEVSQHSAIWMGEVLCVSFTMFLTGTVMVLAESKEEAEKLLPERLLALTV